METRHHRPCPEGRKDKECVASYRLIAVTSHVSKLVEKLILARLSNSSRQSQRSRSPSGRRGPYNRT